MKIDIYSGFLGAGKTTLIKTLCGNVIPDSGSILFDKNIKVGYLDQYMNIDKTLTIDHYLKGAFLSLYKKEEEMNQMLDDLSNTEDPVLIDRYVRVTTGIREELEANDFYVDATAMYLITNPLNFDVIVSSNLFGDILSDESAGATQELPSCSSFPRSCRLQALCHQRARTKSFRNRCGCAF